jgi:uncharacterized Zn finger protein
MIQITNLSQFNRAKLRASAGRLTATTSTVWRVYRVTNEEKGVTYRVSFWRDRAGRKWATCECAGAQGGHVCKHMGAALPMHLELMLTVEGRAERKAKAGALPRLPPNPAFEPAPGKFTDPEGADADCDEANWQ